MKKIEITPEWILYDFVVERLVDDKGNIVLVAENISDARWIRLAIHVLGIQNESDLYKPKPGSQNDCEVHWKIKIEDLEECCPGLYDNWKCQNLLDPITEE